jgi:hypothetical protein
MCVLWRTSPEAKVVVDAPPSVLRRTVSPVNAPQEPTLTAELGARLSGSPGARKRSVGHIALMFRPGEGEQASELLRLFGFEVTDMGAHRETSEHWYTAFVDDTSSLEDNVLFLLPAPPAQLAVEERLERLLRDADAAADYRHFEEFAAGDPERSFHFGLRFDSFDDLEAAALRIVEAGAEGGLLAGRVWRQNVFRPTPGIGAHIDERLRRSPLASDDDRRCLGPRGFQLWFRTDLLASNFLALGQVIELDHVFPEAP